MAENTLIAHPSGALPTLQKWFGDGMVDIWGAWPATEKPWIVMSCAVWGDYVKRFIDFSVPTMLTPANLKALAPCWAVIYTDPAGWPVIWEAMRNLEPLGIKLILRLIPEPVLEMLHRDDTNRYWGLSVAQNLGMRVAGHVGAGYHMWMPDHYYGPNYFKSLKRLSPDHDIIAQTGISATLDCLPEIYRYRQADGSIAIPDRDLGTIALRHLHPQSRAYCMNQAEPFTEMPGAHFIWWQGRNAIHTYCCHQNATWLSPRVCTHAPNFVPATIDTRLPHFGQKFYVPTLSDEMTFAEFSGANKAALQGLVPGNVFFARCWSQVGFSLRYRDYFMQPSLTPIEPQTTFMTDGAIARQHKQVADRLWAERPPEWMGTLVQ